MRRVIVTGGAGFLGSHLVDRLLTLGDHVTVLDNLSTGHAANLAQHDDEPRLRFISCDVVSFADIAGHADVIFHLASPASPAVYGRLTIETLLAGSSGTLHALEVADRYRARFVLAGSSEVYGDPAVHPQPESYHGDVDPTGPRSCYGEAKRYAEALVTAFRRERGVNTGIVRLFNVYGPRMGLDDGRVIPQFIGQALRGEPFTIDGDGSQSRSFCYVDDVIEALVRMGDSECTVAGPVNVGRPDELTIREVAEAVAVVAQLGRQPHWLHRPRQHQDPQRRCPDISLAGRLLGWKPEIDFGEGLSKTIAWYREHVQ